MTNIRKENAEPTPSTVKVKDRDGSEWRRDPDSLNLWFAPIPDGIRIDWSDLVHLYGPITEAAA